MADAENDKILNRRRFFRTGLKELLRPLANVKVHPIQTIAEQMAQIGEQPTIVEPTPAPPPPAEARPPVTGAVGTRSPKGLRP